MKKIILVTGSSTGFGELIVKKLASKGHTVYASMRNLSTKNKDNAMRISKWADDTKYDVYPIELDVTNDASVDTAIAHIISKSGRIDVVVNNAGVGNFGAALDYSIKEVQQLFDVNFYGPLRLSKAVLPHMKKQKSGHIIQISSQLGRVVFPFMSVYSASKFALEALSEGLSEELKDIPIHVTVVQPGGYPTDFTRNIFAPAKNELYSYGPVAKKVEIGMGHFMESMKGANAPNPQDVADAVDAVIEKPVLRVVVGKDGPGAETINEVTQKVQSQMLDWMGLK